MAEITYKERRVNTSGFHEYTQNYFERQALLGMSCNMHFCDSIARVRIVGVHGRHRGQAMYAEGEPRGMQPSMPAVCVGYNYNVTWKETVIQKICIPLLKS